MFPLARLLLLPLLAYQFVVQAAPNSSPDEVAPPNCVDGCSKRTLFNIIWGCVSTTIICAWTAIHPNIPPRESYLKGTLRRLELMCWTIIAPEILPTWALNQLLAAKTIRDVYNQGLHQADMEESCGFVKRWFAWRELPAENSQAWTLKHGHFVIMGGFHLVEPLKDNSTSPEASTGTQQAAVDVQATNTPSVEGTQPDAEQGRAPGNQRRVTILTLEMLRQLVQDREFRSRIRITEDEIADRSKGDALSRIIFILQSSWFIFQCIERHVQALNLTQLELTTLALASLNASTFILWWNKPLGVQVPVRVYMNRELTDEERDAAGRGRSVRSKWIPFVQQFVQFRMTAIRDVILCRARPLVILLFPLYIAQLIASPITLLTFAFGYTIADIAGASSSFPADATHVPTFYVPRHQYSPYFHISLLMALGTIFGGIHCVGWQFPFPSLTQQKLWFFSSIAVTIYPIVAPFVVIILSPLRIHLEDGTIRPIDREKLIAAGIYIIGYARLVLLGLAVILLRHQPPAAFTAVNWTKFYPHIL